MCIPSGRQSWLCLNFKFQNLNRYKRLGTIWAYHCWHRGLHFKSNFRQNFLLTTNWINKLLRSRRPDTIHYRLSAFSRQTLMFAFCLYRKTKVLPETWKSVMAVVVDQQIRHCPNSRLERKPLDHQLDVKDFSSRKCFRERNVPSVSETVCQICGKGKAFDWSEWSDQILSN